MRGDEPTPLPFLFFLICCAVAAIGANENTYFTNEWIVELDGGGEKADRLAAKYGYVNRGVVGSLESFFSFVRPSHPRRSKRSAHFLTRRLRVEPEVRWVEQQVGRKRVKREFSVPKDPLWPQQWYLRRADGMDHNVMPVWKQGISGKDVVVSILDDGIEYTHPDIKDNYDDQASYDANDNDEDPFPRYTYSSYEENRHGTRCAGEVAAAKNSVCGVGVAFNSKIGGVRMLDGVITDSTEARSLGLNPQHVDIYSSSWGPDDDGATVDGPGRLTRQVLKDGVEKGRNGRGSIFVWASGNGGRDHDCCNCDGYTNSIYTLSISSATSSGVVPWYLESCSSTLASTFSSGNNPSKMISSTDLHGKCTTEHSGTSASAPLAAGLLALALEANPDLTWRDVQHIVVRSSRVVSPNGLDWTTNGVGRKVSHKFGYGIIDAASLVNHARLWTTAPSQHVCEVSERRRHSVPVAGLELRLSTDGCRGSDAEVRYLEHVQARVTIYANPRGSISIALTSPSGTRSQLLHYRPNDKSQAGFHEWPFMTTHNWGEDPAGIWTLSVEHKGARVNPELVDWALVLYGTKEPVAFDNDADDDARRSSPNNSSRKTLLSTTSSAGMVTGSPLTEHCDWRVFAILLAVSLCGSFAVLVLLIVAIRSSHWNEEKKKQWNDAKITGKEAMELLKRKSPRGNDDDDQEEDFNKDKHGITNA